LHYFSKFYYNYTIILTRLLGILLTFILVFHFNANATNYTSEASGGDWETNGTWVGGSAPGTTLSSGDSVFIVSSVTYVSDLKINGVVVISSAGSLKGYTKTIKVGNGSNSGELYNSGVINAKKVEVKGLDKTYVSGIPYLYNADTIVTGKMHSGTNSEAGTSSSGKTTNATTGYILISSTLGDAKGELHVDGELENCGIIEAETKFKVHGSSVLCCGAIYTPLVEFDINKDRPGTLGCINICTTSGSSTEPTYEVKDGTSRSSLVNFTDNEGSGSGGFHTDTDFSIDSNNTYSCGTSLTGATWGGLGSDPLPVELTSFTAYKEGNHIVLTWKTQSELNNDFFTLERSHNGQIWSFVSELKGAGNSNTTQTYSATDRIDFPNIMYYRLSQTDFDGNKTYFPLRSIEINATASTFQYALFPNPANEQLHISGEISEVEEIMILDETGRVMPNNWSKYETEATIDVSNFKTGVYTIHIVRTNGVENHRAIISNL